MSAEVMAKVVASASEGVKRAAETVKPVEALKPLSEMENSVANEANKATDDLVDKAGTEGPRGALQSFADGKNINEAGMDNRRKIMSDTNDETPTVETSDAYQSKADTNPDNENKVHQSQAHTNPDTTRDQQTEPPAEDNEMTGEQVLDKMNKDADARKINENWKKIYEATNPDKDGATYQSKADTNPDNENKVHQSQAHTNPDTTRDQAEAPVAEDKKTVETSDAYQSQTPPEKGAVHQSQKDKNPDNYRQEAPVDTKDQTPNEEIQIPEDKKIDAEKNEDPKSEKQKQIEEKMQMADIVSQMKDINPNFNPKDPETRKFLEDLAGNPDQMKAAGDTLKMLSENKTNLENLGFNPEDVNSKTVEAMSEQVDKKVQEHAKKSNPTKEEEDENKNNISLLSLLKILLGGALVSVGATVMTAGKELSKK